MCVNLDSTCAFILRVFADISLQFCISYRHLRILILQLPEAYLKIPVLVPNLDYHYDIPVICVNESGAADVIRVFVCSPTSAVPSISAIVNMPLSEIDVEEQ